MAITLKHSIVCDDVRMENNGKFMILGMYTPDIGVAQLPFLAPTLTFVLWLESDRPGNFQFRAKLSHLESGSVFAEVMGGVQFARPGVGICPIRLVGIRFPSAGGYTFSVAFDGEELLTNFSVILNVPMMSGSSPLPGFPRPGP